MHLAALDGNVARPPGGDRAGVADDDGVVRQPLAQLPGDDLRLHRLVRRVAALVHQLAPLLHVLPARRSRKSRFSLRLSSGSSSCRGRRGCRRPGRPPPDSAGRCAWDRCRSARRAPARAWAEIRCRETTCRPSAACRTLPSPPAKAWCRAGRCRRSCKGCRRARRPCPAAALMIGAPSVSATAPVRSLACKRAAAGEDRDLLCRHSECRRRVRRSSSARQDGARWRHVGDVMPGRCAWTCAVAVAFDLDPGYRREW